MFFSRIFIFITALLLYVTSQADVGICFETDGNLKKPISLIFTIKSDAEATVRYKEGSIDIFLTKIGEKTISPRAQVPATVQTKWKENTNGVDSGYYYLTSTGANAVELLYVRGKDGKYFKFFDKQQNPELNCG